MKVLNKITALENDFHQWFIDVVKQGNLIAYGPTKGSIIFKPLAYSLWENIQNYLNKIFHKFEIQNVYLPLLIPEKLIKQEAAHIKGFAPELATITRIGTKNLEEPLVIRPTSEVLFSKLFSEEISSYQDLPLTFNQWVNVIRWEKKTNPFLRTSEFLWQEGHGAYASSIEAKNFSKKIVRLYANFCKKYLAIPVIIGKKTNYEKFAGAIDTYTIEAMMKNGKALQSATSHYFGQNFARVFKVMYKQKNQTKDYVYQSSWGLSTRIIGAIIMTHGDNRGIIMPPKVAPYQIDILTLFAYKNNAILVEAQKIQKSLNRIYRVRLDASDKNPGFKASQSEIEGTPLRIEIGPRDINDQTITLIRRDTLEKTICTFDQLKIKIKFLLSDIENNLLNQAKKRLKDAIVTVYDYAKFKEQIAKNKFVLAPFIGDDQAEKTIQEQTGASTRCIPWNYQLKDKAKCIITKKITKRYVLFAKAY